MQEQSPGAGIQAQAQQEGIAPPPATPSIEDTNAVMDNALQQWMGNIENAYKTRVDNINQDTLAHMRGAANMAANAGLSFGGSFADAQRQVFMSGQRAQNEAYANYMNQLGQPLSMQADMDFRRQMRDEDWNRQDDILAGQNESDMIALLGDTVAEFESENGRSPFYNAAGTQIPFQYLPQEFQEEIRSAAGDQDPAQWYQENIGEITLAAGGSSQQVDANKEQRRNLLAQQSNDWDDLTSIAGNFDPNDPGDMTELISEINAVIKDGVSPEDIKEFFPEIAEYVQ